MAQEFSPEQMEKLLEYASRRLKTTPQALREAFQNGGLYGVAQQAQGTAALTPEEAARAQAMLQDRSQIEQLLQNPEVQKLLQQLSGGQ